jgi:type II restriction enzyme
MSRAHGWSETYCSSHGLPFLSPPWKSENRWPRRHDAREGVGCNIVLAHIPPDARIHIITEGQWRSPRAVREQYKKLRPLAKLQVRQRGWTLDTLNAIRSLGTSEFTLNEAYSLKPALSVLHPDNHHVHDKIRQQLQVLRDLGLLEFLGGGNYRLR